MRLALSIPCLLLAIGHQTGAPPPQSLPQAPRDSVRRPLPPEPHGTAVIRGRVVASDTGNPIPRANVTLSMLPPAIQPPAAPAASRAGRGNARNPSLGGIGAQTQTMVVNGAPAEVSSALGMQTPMLRPKTARTDAQGAFEFQDLPAGTYRLSANPGTYSAQYLAMAYGAKKPATPGNFDPGQPIPLADGQTFAATVALLKGSVIAGRVTDERGEPLARIQVYPIMFVTGATRGQRFGANAQTDDLGQFRLFGLPPGDYTVVGEARNNAFTPPNAPPETEDDRIGLLTTYFPGTADESAAQRVRIKAGDEASGIEIRMVSGRLLHISGMVVDSQGQAGGRFNGQLMHRSGASLGFNSFGFGIDQTGRFQIRNVPPGDYRLIVRQNQNRPPDRGAPPDPGEAAVMPVSLASDLDDILVRTTPGAQITGQVVYVTGPPVGSNQPEVPLRISAQPADPQNTGGVPMPPPATVTSELTFTMKGLFSECLLRANGGPSAYLESVQVSGEDVTDTPHEFRQGDRVTIVMTTRASTVEGTITDDRGQPVADAYVILFGQDKRSWRLTSVRTRRGGSDQTGVFRLPGVLPGSYFLIAVTRDRGAVSNMGSVDASVFEELSKEATGVTVAGDEQRQVDLKIAAGSGGD